MEFSLVAVGRSKTFWITIAVFLLANAWSWLRHVFFPLCCDQEMTIGFPFPFHISGGISDTSNFYLLGLLLDLTIALTFAVTATWLAGLLRRFR